MNTLKIKSFMIEKCPSNNIENDAFKLNADESEYKILINRLKEIRSNIALLEKIIFE